MKRLVIGLAIALMLTGCLGRGAANRNVRKFNLNTIEHRWGRATLFTGLQVIWVYRIATLLDLLIFNSIEFWSGANPINGRSPLVDVPMSEVQKMGFQGLKTAQVERLSETEAKLHLRFENGDQMAFDVIRDDSEYTVSYLDRVFFKGKIDADH